MASSPFGCNQNSLFGKQNKKSTAAAPPEAVELIADPCQVITAVIPFGTKQAPNIRKTMHENITHDGQRIFIYRQVNGWTNISLESTETAPKLTADPITALKTAWREFNSCPFVSAVNIKWKGQNNVLGYDDIDHMETQFVPLPTGDESDEPKKTDGEVIFDTINEVKDKLVAMDTKISYLTDVIDSIYKMAKDKNGESSSNQLVESGSSSTSPLADGLIHRAHEADLTPTTVDTAMPKRNGNGKRRASL